MVLLKGFGADGFRFFTNYESAKAAQLDAGGAAALIAYWRELDRQVRVRGTVERLGAEDSDAYFATRPRDSQLGAWASPQSRPLESRAELDTRLAEADASASAAGRCRGRRTGAATCCARGRSSSGRARSARLHDRFRYARDGDGWRIERLAP